MTDQQRLLVALLTENDDVIDADGEMSPLELMAVLFDLGDARAALASTQRGEQ